MFGIVLGGGTPPSSEIIEAVTKGENVIVCADGGANTAYKYNLDCKAIIGDSDSIDKEVKKHFKNKNCEFVEYSPEKDYTDTELAIKYLIEEGIDFIIMLGCTGTRIDHTLANIGLMVDYAIKGCHIKIIDDNNIVQVVKSSKTISGPVGAIFSLQAFREDVTNLKIEGAKYPLNGIQLRSGSPLTVSNVFEEKNVSISFDSGILLLIFPRD
ncbi:thiamine pyrophosphokinase [Hathewaya proteolytica DSM 3090]|uniref:Thiamine diphosphokinase n=1 Tax=Hathewaya proteolytica DSM 3090 TaxID=1121331 RepID=A0A1M6JA16_9CLOT|nr:thiamine diphosphokinase [Hathewaya proteolytica]SHJ43521.1 thiamine pyrophosphokinase [Hathewaya proteolytica DSM 3090]